MERILIVDDDSDIQRLVSYNLRQAGFQVLKRQTASTSKVRMRRLPSRSILPSFCLVPVLNSLGQQPM